MNEKLQYATMLEIPVSTSSVTFKQKKKSRGKLRRRDNSEVVKQELLDKINSVEGEANDFSQSDSNDKTVITQQEGLDVQDQAILQDKSIDSDLSFNGDDNLVENTALVHSGEIKQKREKGKFKFSIIGVQLAIIGVLLTAIFLTNALYADSGINVFLRGVFGVNEQSKIDNRSFDDFSPVLSIGDGEVTVDDGLMTFAGEGSVYSPCNGEITSIIQEQNGKYTVEITHSANFKSVLYGIDYAYAELNQKVYSNIPVGYVTSGATMCFKSGDGSVISNYQIVDDTVIWAV